MPKPEVYCTMDDCHYWADGCHCTAEKILITTDRIADTYPEATDADSVQDLVRQHGKTPAEHCVDTCCKTFTPRDKARSAAAPDKMEGKARHLAARH